MINSKRWLWLLWQMAEKQQSRPCSLDLLRQQRQKWPWSINLVFQWLLKPNEWPNDLSRANQIRCQNYRILTMWRKARLHKIVEVRNIWDQERRTWGIVVKAAPRVFVELLANNMSNIPWDRTEPFRSYFLFYASIPIRTIDTITYDFTVNSEWVMHLQCSKIYCRGDNSIAH